ncbi:GT-D fold domain-containing glycosyltransferase [Paenibacillus tarimensis]
MRIKKRKRKPGATSVRRRKISSVQKRDSGAANSQGYDTGYQEALRLAEKAKIEGYDLGFNQGYDKGYNKGYDTGSHSGGDGIIDQHLPEYEILPEVSVEEVMSAGIAQLRSRILHLMTAAELGERIITALDTRTPLSVVRLGDGELLTMAQETVLSIAQVREEGKFLDYAGVQVPDLEARDLLVKTVLGADIVGIPKLRIRNYQPLAFAVFRAHGIDYRNLKLTDSLVNYYLYHGGYLPQILSGRKVLLIGNLAPALADRFRPHGIHIAGTVSPVQGIKDVPRVMGEVAGHDFDIALVSAGISAVVISRQIASEMGKVAIDFGHLADSMVKGDAPFQ